MSLSWQRIFYIFVLSLFCLSLVRCKDDTVAANGTVLNLTAEPQQVAIHGTSNLTATGTFNGDPLPDGTVLRFILESGTGSIDPSSAETKAGSASVKFEASGVAGKATISVVSGSSTATIDIEVIGDTDERIFLIANPQDLPSGGGTTTLTAAVTDSLGNPLEGERVLFSTTEGNLKSNGQFVTTDSEGHASDELTTNKTAEVTADALDTSAEPAKLTITVGSEIIVCSFSITPENPSVGTQVTFTDTTEIDPQRIFSSIWDFGDGTSRSGVTVQHTYTSAGTFRIAHTLVDVSNNTYTCSTIRLTVFP
jgi:PKD repeat protein